MEGSTIEKEDNFDELDNVFTENTDVKTETTSERTDRVNEEDSLESDPSELGSTNDKSHDSNANAEREGQFMTQLGLASVGCASSAIPPHGGPRRTARYPPGFGMRGRPCMP